MRNIPRLRRPRRSFTARSRTTMKSQFCAFDPVGALSASSIRWRTSASSTGSGLRRRIARCVRIASSSDIEKGDAVVAARLVSGMVSSLGGSKHGEGGGCHPARAIPIRGGPLEGRRMPVDLRTKVAIVGVGCTPFGELYDKSAEDLMCDAVGEALADAG